MLTAALLVTATEQKQFCVRPTARGVSVLQNTIQPRRKNEAVMSLTGTGLSGSQTQSREIHWARRGLEGAWGASTENGCQQIQGFGSVRKCSGIRGDGRPAL